jgi:hypothetical protein
MASREEMHAIFPLTEGKYKRWMKDIEDNTYTSIALWRDWIEDVRQQRSDVERYNDQVTELYDMATQDYLGKCRFND